MLLWGAATKEDRRRYYIILVLVGAKMDVVCAKSPMVLSMYIVHLHVSLQQGLILCHFYRSLNVVLAQESYSILCQF